MELQTALITGAGGLLGPIHAQALAEQNCNLIITDIELEKIEQRTGPIYLVEIKIHNMSDDILKYAFSHSEIWAIR